MICIWFNLKTYNIVSKLWFLYEISILHDVSINHNVMYPNQMLVNVYDVASMIKTKSFWKRNTISGDNPYTHGTISP